MKNFNLLPYVLFFFFPLLGPSQRVNSQIPSTFLLSFTFLVELLLSQSPHTQLIRPPPARFHTIAILFFSYHLICHIIILYSLSISIPITMIFFPAKKGGKKKEKNPTPNEFQMPYEYIRRKRDTLRPCVCASYSRFLHPSRKGDIPSFPSFLIVARPPRHPFSDFECRLIIPGGIFSSVE